MSVSALNPAARAAVTPGQTLRVLILDDRPDTDEGLESRLREAGCRVQRASSGEEALRQTRDQTPDLLLLGAEPPGGSDLIGRFREEAPGVPVVLVRDSRRGPKAGKAMEWGVWDLLDRAPDPERLALMIRNALDFSRLSRQVEDLRAQLQGKYRFDEIVGVDGGLRESVLMLEKLISTDLTVLLLGESGTGKGIFARAIHFEGPRRDGPFITVNCAALPQGLLESELFGHEKGAFTGADSSRRGKFEAADGGTIFLDEIGEMPLAVQARLLRVLQERSVSPLGGGRSVSVDVRVVCATRHDLERRCREGRFRQDLYYRLAVFPLTLPPLRERKEDIPALVEAWLSRAGGEVPGEIDPQAMTLLESYDWPGNVRELHNALRRALVLAGDGPLLPQHLPARVQAGTASVAGPLLSLTRATASAGLLENAREVASLEQVEREHLLRAVEHFRGNLSRTSRRLVIGRTILCRKLRKYGIA